MAISLDSAHGSGQAPLAGTLPALASNTRYADMTPVQVVIAVEQLLVRYADEDADRARRLATILAL